MTSQWLGICILTLLQVGSVLVVLNGYGTMRTAKPR